MRFGSFVPLSAVSLFALDGEYERIADLRKFRVDARSALGTVVLNLLEESPVLKVFQNLFGRARILGCAMSCRGP